MSPAPECARGTVLPLSTQTRRATGIPPPDTAGQVLLFHPRSATLNENKQQDDRDNSRDYPDDHCVVHVNTPFLLRQLVQTFQHDDGSRSQRHQEQRWKDKQDQRKHQLHRRLRRLLFYLLAPLRSERIGVNT